MPKKYVDFKVSGRGDFPYDMLRYDQCWPADQDSAAKFHHSYNRDRREVKLRIFGDEAEITFGRWSSFLWPVIEVNGVPTSELRR